MIEMALRPTQFRVLKSRAKASFGKLGRQIVSSPQCDVYAAAVKSREHLGCTYEIAQFNQLRSWRTLPGWR
jgi:hypothetical protein